MSLDECSEVPVVTLVPSDAVGGGRSEDFFFEPAPPIERVFPRGEVIGVKHLGVTCLGKEFRQGRLSGTAGTIDRNKPRHSKPGRPTEHLTSEVINAHYSMMNGGAATYFVDQLDGAVGETQRDTTRL